MVWETILLIAGFFLLIKGADFLVAGSSSLARKFGVSPLFIGLTIVAFGTSSPELAVSISAAISGFGEVTVSNIVGSNILNLVFILGLTAAFLPVSIKVSTIKKEIPFLILITAAFILLFFNGDGYRLETSEGIILLIFFIIYLEYIFSMAKNDRELNKKIDTKVSLSAGDSQSRKMQTLIILTVSGLIMVLLGGKITVDSAVKIASMFGISEALISITVVALGTSLPELVTSFTAVIKKEIDIAAGNIIGSNIMNILLILGISSLFGNLTVQVPFFWVDLLFLLFSTVLIWIFSGTKKKIERIEGVILFVCYLFYLLFLIIRK